MEIMLLSVFLAAECLVLNTLCCALLRGDVAVVDPVCCEALYDVLLPVHRCAGGGGSTRPKLWLKPVMPMNGVIIGGAGGGGAGSRVRRTCIFDQAFFFLIIVAKN